MMMMMVMKKRKINCLTKLFIILYYTITSGLSSPIIQYHYVDCYFQYHGNGYGQYQPYNHQTQSKTTLYQNNNDKEYEDLLNILNHVKGIENLKPFEGNSTNETILLLIAPYHTDHISYPAAYPDLDTPIYHSYYDTQYIGHLYPLKHV